MVAGIFGAAGSHNDVGVLNLSHHTEYLEELLFLDYVMAGGMFPALFGYSTFQNVNHHVKPTYYGSPETLPSFVNHLDIH